MADTTSGDVFKALADPTRRALLDSLFVNDGQTLQQLCSVAPLMTRFGVMKHVALLESANLVVTRRVGRSKVHHLNTVPIGQIADRWISKYSRSFTHSLVALAAELSDGRPASHHEEHAS